MQQIKIFLDIESACDDLESKVNAWLSENDVKIVNIFGNIAPQTVTKEAPNATLGQKFRSSDLLVVIVYEKA